MQAYKLALASALLLGTSVAYAGEKASYSGVNKDVQVLSELSSTVPGQEGHVIKQITETWKYTSPNKEFDGALGIAVDQQEIVGDQLSHKGYAMSRSTEPAPITAGPRTRVRSRRTPASITTRPSSVDSIMPQSRIGSMSLRGPERNNETGTLSIDAINARNAPAKIPGAIIGSVTRRSV